MSKKPEIGFERRDWAAIVLAAIFVLIFLAVHPIQKLINGDWNIGKNQNLEPGHFIDWATLLVLAFQAWVYYEQRRLMGRQADIMERQRATAANEFRWTHRPRIIIRMVRPHLESLRGDRCNAEFAYVNIGETPAFIAEIGTRISLGWSPATYGAKKIHFDDVRTPLSPLESGEKRTHVTKGHTFKLITHDEIPQSPYKPIFFWCTGYIKYQGVTETGTPDGAMRSVGFCRRWDERGMTFERHVDDDWEYSD